MLELRHEQKVEPVLCFSVMQGAAEKRTEAYMKYGEGASQSATQQSAKSISRVAGFAGKQADATQRRFAAFDFDGTLVRWQLFMAIFYELAEEKLIDEKDYQEVRRLFDDWRARVSEQAYELYAFKAIEIFDKHVSQLSVAVFDTAVDKVFSKYKDQVYTYTRDLVKQLKEDGYYLIAISGSQYQIVEEVSKYYGFDKWTGTKYRIGSKLGTYKDFPAGEKGKTLQEIIKAQNLTFEGSIAVGDTESDIPMLEIVENPIAFNPNKDLLEHAESKHWPIVVERKSVVYRLEYKNGGYKLV